MKTAPVTVALPIADRHTSATFYRTAMDLALVGETTSDGLPEPLQLAVNDGLNLMLIPSDGFGWVIGDRDVATSAQAECILGLEYPDAAALDAAFARAIAAGAASITAPAEQPWGYTALFADPDGHLWQLVIS